MKKKNKKMTLETGNNQKFQKVQHKNLKIKFIGI